MTWSQSCASRTESAAARRDRGFCGHRRRKSPSWGHASTRKSGQLDLPYWSSQTIEVVAGLRACPRQAVAAVNRACRSIAERTVSIFDHGLRDHAEHELTDRIDTIGDWREERRELSVHEVCEAPLGRGEGEQAVGGIHELASKCLTLHLIGVEQAQGLARSGQQSASRRG